jgi:hypothetical protein
MGSENRKNEYPMHAERLQHSARHVLSSVTETSAITSPTTSLEGKGEREQLGCSVGNGSDVELKHKAAPVSLVVPAGHGRQKLEPAVSAKNPGAHGEQEADASRENVPGGQVAQALQM